MAVDFEDIRRRLDHAGSVLSGERDPAAEAALLAERSRHLATRRRRRVEPEIRHEVVAFERAGERYGVPIHQVGEVRQVRLATLPGLPSAVVGLFQIRGAVHSLADLAAVFGRPDPPRHGEDLLALVVQSASGPLGLRVDHLLGPRRLGTGDCLEEDRASHDDVDFVLDVSRDLVAVLDIDRLAQSPEISPESPTTTD